MLRNTLNKKGDMTFGQITAAVIALIILVVLMMIFSGKMGNVNKEMDSCQLKAGKCVNEADCNGIPRDGTFSDCQDPMVCCVNLYGEES